MSPPAHHRPDGTFANPPGSPVRKSSLRRLVRFMWRQTANRGVPTLAEGLMETRSAAGAALAAAGNPSLTWLGHASFLIRMDGRTILTDPYLARRAGPWVFGPPRFAPPPIPVEALPPIDLLVVSHNHYDHLDMETIRRLPDRARTTVVVPLGLTRYFARLGFARIVELDWWEAAALGPLTVTALPAVHFSRRGLFDLNRTLWASFAIEGRDAKLWFGGDSAHGPVFEEIGARAGPFDLALVGIGAYEPREIMKTAHATPEEGVAMARALRAVRAVGMHWGTVKLTPEDPFEAAPRFRQAAFDQGYGEDNAWILRIGETRALAALRARRPAAE